MNLLEPLTPPRFTTAACPGANLNNVPYVGITAGLNGDNSRVGPARAYLPDGRFPAGCSVGFDVYCLGDPIEDQTGSTNQETWVTSRWLRVAKQPRGWRSAMAHVLSGENTQPQFISDEFVTPESAYSDLPYGNRSCPGRFPLPGHTQLQRFDAKADTFTADATDATNMGFAVYVPPGQGFRNGGAYLQIYNAAGTPAGIPADNPGETLPDGSKSVEWPYQSSLQEQLQPPTGRKGSGGHVVVMAVACLADNIPAPTDTAATAGYQVPSTGPPTPSSVIPNGMNMNQLARAACEAST
jgi:hypothetical protein